MRLQTLTLDGDRAVARFTDIVIQDGVVICAQTHAGGDAPGTAMSTRRVGRLPAHYGDPARSLWD